MLPQQFTQHWRFPCADPPVKAVWSSIYLYPSHCDSSQSNGNLCSHTVCTPLWVCVCVYCTLWDFISPQYYDLCLFLVVFFFFSYSCDFSVRKYYWKVLWESREMAQWLGRLAMSKFCWARSVDLTIEHLLSRSKALNCQPQKVCSKMELQWL